MHSFPISVSGYFRLRFFVFPCCYCSVVSVCDPMDCSSPDSPVLHRLPEFAPIHVPWVGCGIWPSHLLLPPSPFAFSLSQHQGLFQWVGCSHQVAKVLEFQHQSFQWIFRVDFLQDWLVWSCSPRDSQESSAASEFKSTNSSSLANCKI